MSGPSHLCLWYLGDKPWQCTICGIKVTRHQTLKNHMLLVHPDAHVGGTGEDQQKMKFPFYCSQCDRGFVSGLKLRNHQRVCDPLHPSHFPLFPLPPFSTSPLPSIPLLSLSSLLFYCSQCCVRTETQESSEGM